MSEWLLIPNKWLEWPVRWVCYWLEWRVPSSEWLIVYKVGLIALFVTILLAVLFALRRRLLHHSWKRSFTADDRIEKPEQRPAHIDALEAARDVDRVVDPLKKVKAYDRVAEVYASVNQPLEAAAWYEKAGDRKAAAQQWALAGETRKAAALLLKEGEYATAARFLEEVQRFAEAASAYEKAGDNVHAATAYARAGKPARAAELYEAYFAGTQDPSPQQLQNAEACYAWLQDDTATQELGAEQRDSLLAALAPRFEAGGTRDELAAQLYRAAGQTAKAGELYARAGLFQEAAHCMQDAGRTREAWTFLACHCESAGRWEDAGKAYAALGDHRAAGDAFAKARNLAAAAGSFEKAGEHYLAAAAHGAVRNWLEVARLAELVKPGNPKSEAARTLLGQALFELKDYARSAQVLDELLAGKWIDDSNVALMYALGVAWESAGQPGKACEAYRKVRMFNAAYKDVDARLARCGGIETEPISHDSWSSDAEDNTASDPVAMQAVQDIVGPRYRFERELGRGGMGVIYLARDLQLDRLVAVKFLGSLADRSPEYRERFFREAKAAAKVSHPNIVAVYDIGGSPGKAHLVMECVTGPDLRTYIHDKDKLAPREAVHFASQIASALDAIHKAGLVHRDVKPDNILLDKGGIVKLTDFGIAKAEQARITQPNVRMGTPAYMAPEQERTSDVDGRADIYSLGLVLHEMLTGKPVFSDVAEEREGVAIAPPSATAPDIPPALDAVVLTCLAKRPEDRYQSAATLLAALRKALT